MIRIGGRWTYVRDGERLTAAWHDLGDEANLLIRTDDWIESRGFDALEELFLYRRLFERAISARDVGRRSAATRAAGSSRAPS